MKKLVFIICIFLLLASSRSVLAASGDPGPNHWSRTEPFGHNIPKDLKATTLEQAQNQLRTAGLTVRCGPTQVIIPMNEIGSIAVGKVLRFPNSDLQVFTHPVQMRSSDGGQTWKQVHSEFTDYACCLANGRIIQFADEKIVFHNDIHPEPGMITASTRLLSSDDNGSTVQSEPVTFTLPEKITSMCPRRFRIIQLKNGDLIASDYVKHLDDPETSYPTWVTKTGKVHNWPFRKNRVIVIRSQDNGKTWRYLATVACDFTKSMQYTILGFVEPDIVLLPNDDILCFMRTVGGGGIRPLYMNRSRDGGKTWSVPFPVADRGTTPYTCLLDNGVLVVSYGRPGDWLMFSTDLGQTWTGHFQFFMGNKGWDGWNNFSIEKVAPDKILAVYVRTDPKATPGTKETRRGEVLGTFFTIEKIK